MKVGGVFLLFLVAQAAVRSRLLQTGAGREAEDAGRVRVHESEMKLPPLMSSREHEEEMEQEHVDRCRSGLTIVIPAGHVTYF